jgi:hypothetical protein
MLDQTSHIYVQTTKFTETKQAFSFFLDLSAIAYWGGSVDHVHVPAQHKLNTFLIDMN